MISSGIDIHELSNYKMENENQKHCNFRRRRHWIIFTLRIVRKEGSGPFLAAIYDGKGKLIAKKANSVVSENCSNNHAEMNTIKAAEELLGYDLSSQNLSLYVTSEPCIMCIGSIMWSGIKAVYYGVPSKRVEEITGFDEGFKPNWFEEFKKRGITVYGNIESKLGEEVLKSYVKKGHIIYRPNRS